MSIHTDYQQDQKRRQEEEEARRPAEDRQAEEAGRSAQAEQAEVVGQSAQAGQAEESLRPAPEDQAAGARQPAIGQAMPAARAKKRRARSMGAKTEALISVLLLLAGSFLIAVSFNMFLVPLGIASGGVSGISILVHYMTGIPPAYTQWALNVPLFLVGLWVLGKRFALKTALGSFVLPLLVLVTSDWKPLTDNAMLASIYGGIGVGAGLGLVFRGKASTGGLDLAAQLLHRFTGIRLGLAVACFDGLVIASAGILIAPENALYALIGLFATSRTIDFVQTGLAISKVAFIISDCPDTITQVVLHDLDRGLTKLDGHGGYTGTSRTVLMVVVGRGEVSKLKSLVRAADPSAFVIISDTAEVLGEGFQLA